MSIVPFLAHSALPDSLFTWVPDLTHDPVKGLIWGGMLVFLPQMYRVALTGFGKYDNINPRAQLTRMSDTNPNKGEIERAQAAHANGLESWPFFAAGVILARSFAPAAFPIGKYVNLWLIARFLYSVLYIKGTSKPLSVVRSVMWLLGTVASVKLMASAVTN